jgi:hypothetical protein
MKISMLGGRAIKGFEEGGGGRGVVDESEALQSYES